MVLKTGINSLDYFLKGGLRGGTVFDVYGPSGVGKSQLAYQISINSAIQGKNILFHDTMGKFRPERILEILQERGLDTSLLDKIKVIRITNTFEQENFLVNIFNNLNLSLLVVDNISNLFSFEYKNYEQNYEKISRLMRYMHNLSHFSISSQIPVLITNEIREKNNKIEENLFQAIDLYSHFKLQLKKLNGKFSAYFFPSVSEKKFVYSIEKIGLVEQV